MSGSAGAIRPCLARRLRDRTRRCVLCQALNEAKEEGRITLVTKDPLLPIKAFCDLGGPEQNRCLCHVDLPVRRHRDPRPGLLRGCRRTTGGTHSMVTGSGWGKSDIFLPHDGASHDMVYDVSFESAFRSAGFRTEVIPNQGRGAARARIEAAEDCFPSVWFNQETTEAGRDALGWYHEKKSGRCEGCRAWPRARLGVSRSDAFGLMAVAYEMPRGRPDKLKYQRWGSFS